MRIFIRHPFIKSMTDDEKSVHPLTVKAWHTVISSVLNDNFLCSILMRAWAARCITCVSISYKEAFTKQKLAS